MHSLRQILLGCGFTAALLVSATAATATPAAGWLENYYRQPDPAGLAPAMFELSRTGYLDDAENVPRTLGFLAAVFAQHPERVDGWLAFSRDLPVAHQRLFAAAAWASGHPQGATALRQQAARASAETRADITALASSAPALEGAVTSRAALELQWGRFLATGDRAPVQSILAALGSDDRATLGQDVRWSLARNAVAHERVLAICREELARAPKEVRESLGLVIRDAEARVQPPRS
jgi:hypothetical protein